MRKAFERQQRLDRAVANQVPLNANCRDEIVPILRALQHLYSQPQVRDEILRKVAADVKWNALPPAKATVTKRG